MSHFFNSARNDRWRWDTPPIFHISEFGDHYAKLTDPLMEFLCNYKLYGFDNKSSMVREALLRLKRELELKQSADLNAEIYEEDADLRELTETAVRGPE